MGGNKVDSAERPSGFTRRLPWRPAGLGCLWSLQRGGPGRPCREEGRRRPRGARRPGRLLCAGAVAQWTR